MKLKRQPPPKAEVAMTPLIDCVFLLLVFFMVSTTFNKQEADISFALTAPPPSPTPSKSPTNRSSRSPKTATSSSTTSNTTRPPTPPCPS
jgi:biopolymer transport protein ExbD